MNFYNNEIIDIVSIMYKAIILVSNKIFDIFLNAHIDMSRQDIEIKAR